MKKCSVLFCTSLLLCHTSLYARTTGLTVPDNTLSLIASLVDILQENSVDPVDMEGVQRGAIQGVLRSLDSHSRYISPDEYREMTKTDNGKRGGVGLDLTMRNGVLTVVTSIKGMSAYRHGIRSGDQIHLIDGESLQGKTLIQMVATLRGVLNTKVSITVQAVGTRNRREVSLLRSVLPKGAVYSKMLTPNLLYIRLYLFNHATTRELRKRVSRALKKKLTGIILDLRDNPGGPLDQAVHVADLFLNKGIIVSVRGRNKMNRVFRAHSGSRGGEIPMLVLVNGGTASSAEIVTAALQEQKRALVVGTRTYGKGTVQNIFPLSNGAAIQLTTGRYYTPSGKSIKGIGIEPDIVLRLPQMSDQEIIPGAEGKSGQREWLDIQLQEARSIITGLGRTGDEMDQEGE